MTEIDTYRPDRDTDHDETDDEELMGQLFPLTTNRWFDGSEQTY